MSILCGLGRHRAGPRPRWNDGYYFSTCKRCGRDLVRTPFEGWKVPVGYRVVWSHKPPENRPVAVLAPECVAAHEIAPEDRPVDAPPVTQPTAPSPAAPSVISRADPAKERSIFGWAEPQSSSAQKGEAPASDLSIGEVLRILREEEEQESRAGAPSVPASSVPDDEPLGRAETSDPYPIQSAPGAEADMQTPEGGTVAPDPEPLDLVLGQVEREAEPEPTFEAVDAVAGELGEQERTHTDPIPDSATMEGTHEAVAPSPPGPFDDFMDEPNPAAEGNDFWSPPADDRLAQGGPDLGPADPAPSGAKAETPAHILVARPPMPETPPHSPSPDPEAEAQAPGGPIANAGDRPGTGPAETEPQRERPGAGPDDLIAETAAGGEGAANPAAVEDEGPAPASLIDARARGRSRNRERSRMGLRIAIAALTLATAFIVTKVSGFEIAELGVADGAPAGHGEAGQAYVGTAPADCLTGPAPGARALRELPRGEPVRVLTRESGWASVGHAGGQCWVAERSLSAEPPL